MRRVSLSSLILSLVLWLSISPVYGAEPIVLRFAHMNPATSYSSIHCVEPWIKKIEEASKGRVKVQVYYGQTLAKGKDMWNANKMGIADITFNFHGYWPGTTPLSDVMSLPALPFTTAEQGSEVWWKLYEKYPQIQEEFSDNHVLLVFTSEPYYLITRDKPVQSVEDLQGMKIRMTGGPPTEMMKALGGVPVAMPMPDTYLAMQKGVVDGMGASWEPIYGFRLYEVANYYTQTPFPVVFFTISINKDKWNSLPKDAQEAITSVSGLEGSKFWGRNFWDIAKQPTFEKAHQLGKDINVYSLSPQERERWLDIGGKPIWEDWIKRMKKNGHPEAQEILQTVLDLSNDVTGSSNQTADVGVKPATF